MSIDVVVPQVSEGVTSGKVISVAVSVGDQVEADQTLIELETDKAVVSIPSSSAGRVSALKVEEGDTVDVGAVIAVLDEAEEDTSAAEPEEQQTSEANKKVKEIESDEAEKKPSAKKSDKKSDEQSKAPGKDLVVIGAGPGGYHAAFKAAELGLTVTLIDPEEHPGGVCLYRGCIPSKALLHVAKLITESQESAAIGITFSKPKVDLDQVRAWKNDVVEKLTGGLGTK